MKDFYVYMLRCSDQSIYTGHTDDIDKRISEHENGTACSYTAQRLPISVIFVQEVESRDGALVLERQLKGWSRKKKEALINENWNMLKILSKNNQKNEK